MNHKPKLELTWIGKENRPRLEPRILLEDPEKSYHAAHRVTEKDLFDNRLIFGDNLLALKALEAEYTGKVKCVFIDPPYNTGSAFTHYDDGLEHSIWLSLMRDRLEIIRRLLSDDGSLWITIDDNECHYLKVLCDEVFGRGNFLSNFIWKKSYGGGAKSKWFVGLHEHVLSYVKNIEQFPEMFLPPDPGASKKYYKYSDEKLSSRGPYRLQPLATTSMDDRPNLRYPIHLPGGSDIWPEKQWQWSQERVLKAIASNEIVFTEKKGKVTVSYKQYLRDESGMQRMRKPYTIIDGHYTQHGTYESMALFGLNDKFSFPKPEGLIHYILEAATNPGDLVLDSFAGSGTTGSVAHKMGRRWIMVELGEHCHTHIIPRLKKVIDGEDPGGITKNVKWKGGGGFRYYRLAPSLLEKDKWGNWVINKTYNSPMLAEALCKLEGFTYAPSDSIYWQHGHSTERDFIYVTTANLNHEQLLQLSDEVGPNRSLLVLCTAFRGREDYPSLTVKKIPRQVLSRCEWGHDDYSLRVENLPKAPSPPEQGDLFEEGGEQ
ncbi:MAG: Modification methylase MboII [Syntrophus sp. PtaU1.Bin005]|nr:MAG: Modification methylase MboII [Syntrophus sp. PtaU1.Bin005]